VFVPFLAGKERVDSSRLQCIEDAAIDQQTLPGQTLVDSRVALPADLAQAIGTCTALEDYRNLLGQSVPNPFRLVPEQGLMFDGQYVPLSQIHSGCDTVLLRRAREVLGKMAKGATDADIVAACAAPQTPMTLSLFARHQLVSLEALGELPAPYAGCALPAVNWRHSKTRMAVVS
jgi:hypothetical protein